MSSVKSRLFLASSLCVSGFQVAGNKFLPDISVYEDIVGLLVIGGSHSKLVEFKTQLSYGF